MRRFLPLLALVVLLLPLTALASELWVPATKEAVVGDDMAITHPNIYGGGQVFAGTFNVKIDGLTPTLVYCTGSTVNLCLDTKYAQGPDITSPQIIWILNNYYPAVPGMPSELTTDVQRKAAVQLALWHFSDGIDISTGGSDPVVFAAANAIIAAALTAAVPLTPTTLTLTPAFSPQAPGSPVTVTATLRDQNNAVMPGVLVSWTITHALPGGASALTDVNGQVTVSWTEVYQDLLTFRVDYTIPVGLIWTHPGCQNLIQGAQVPGKLIVTWGDPTVPTIPTSWGRIKTLYR